MSHSLFNSIFTETHPELVTLNTNISVLQSIYQSTYNEEKIFDEILEENNNNDNTIIGEQFYNIDNNIFSKIQINYFYKIFNQKSEFFISDIDVDASSWDSSDTSEINPFDSIGVFTSEGCISTTTNTPALCTFSANFNVCDLASAFVGGVFTDTFSGAFVDAFFASAFATRGACRNGLYL